MTTYRERLLPNAGVMVLLLIGPAVLGVAYGAVIGAAAGWLVFAASALAVIVTIVLTSPLVSVDATGLTAGRARLPREAIGPTTVLNAGMRRTVLASQATAFTLLRTWHAPTAVQVDVLDAEDPHPSWVVTTRHPDRLVAAMDALRTSP